MEATRTWVHPLFARSHFGGFVPPGPCFKARTGYPEIPKTIGEAIRKRRLALGMRQRDAARIIGCNVMSVVNWEKGHTQPRVNHMAGIVNFLGFVPSTILES